MSLMLNNPEQPLSEREVVLLAELETVIATNMKGFVLVGMALAQINAARLYRVQYPTFKEYLLRVWDMAPARGYQLIESAEVHGNLKGFLADGALDAVSLPENVHNCRQNVDDIESLLPKNEAQARPLSLFSPEEQREIWLAVLDKASATGSTITANFIIQVILERQRKATDQKIKTHHDRAKKDKTLPPLVKTTYEALLTVVASQNDEDWQSVGKRTMIGLLEDLLEDLKG